MLKDLNSLRSLFSRQDKLFYLGLLGMMFIGTVLDMLGIGAIPAFIAALAIPEKVMAYPLAARVLTDLGITTARELIVWGCITLIIVFILKNIYMAILTYTQIRVMEKHRVRLSDRLFRAYMSAPYEFHLDRNSAELLRNVQTETKEIITGVINPMLNLIMASLMTLSIIVLLVVTMPPVVLVAVALVSASSWLFLRIFRKRLKHYGQQAKKERKESIKAVNQGLSSLVDARILDRTAYFVEAFYRSIEHFARLDRLRLTIAKSSPLVLESIAVIGILVPVLILVMSGSEAESLISILALFGVAVMRLRGSIAQIVANVSQMNFSIAAVPLVVDDLRELEKPSHIRRRDAVQRAAPLALQDAIVLDQITYTYPGGDQPALDNVNVTINKGESVAFVGATGSGKTTLINVVLGLLEPEEGTLTVDRQDVFKNLDGWRANVGYIPQTIFLLDDTIRRNIAFGVPEEEIDEAQLWTAIHAAQLQNFIDSLSKGVETVVGERGVRLSGGQRQRVGLARALYNNPEVLIMDEATSALDNKTESLVMEALESLKTGRTFIMIAHRLSTVRECDRLYFLRDGCVDAVGTYDELTSTHPDFRVMADVA